jgi:hypothetical protein
MEDDRSIAPRGYDDNAYLKEMADGIVSRRFSSVDEAARAVLCEEPGSNVDRLRRKFREQGWYERGLNDYVEAEIARRGGKVEELPHGYLFRRDGRPRDPVETRMLVMFRDLGRGLTPKGPLALLLAGLSAWMFAVHAGVVGTEGLLLTMTTLSVFGLWRWCFASVKSGDKGLLTRESGSLAVLMAVIIIGFGKMMPDSAYIAGSLGGSLTLAIGGWIMGFMLLERMSHFKDVWTLREVAAVFIAMGFAGAQLASGVNTAVERDAAVTAAAQQYEMLLSDIGNQAPGFDTTPFENAQQDLLRKAVRPPEWNRNTAD